MMRYRRDPIVEGTGARWIDDLGCSWCGREWHQTGSPCDGPDLRQYVTINIEPRDAHPFDDPGIHLCPDCADELADTIRALLDEDVPMGRKPEDTDTMCALPNDFYLWRSAEYARGLWWDDDDGCVRDANDQRVPGQHDPYTIARAQRLRPSGPCDKRRR